MREGKEESLNVPSALSSLISHTNLAVGVETESITQMISFSSNSGLASMSSFSRIRSYSLCIADHTAL